jgi:hypothetical protein
MNATLLFAADLLVGVLLVATIASSIRLSRRIAKLKADESAMRATIIELVAASDAAERAVSGLRATIVECERELSERIGAAQHHSRDLARAVSAGEAVIGGFNKMLDSTRRAVQAHPRPELVTPEEVKEPKPESALQAALAAAQAVADRTARRLESRAA